MMWRAAQINGVSTANIHRNFPIPPWISSILCQDRQMDRLNSRIWHSLVHTATCTKARAKKGTDPQTGTDVRLFNPRIDNWTVHFLLNRETGEIQGQTPIGRATVTVLQMNAEQLIGARRLLIGIGVYKDYINTADS
jgi:hypothetical protein